MGVGDVSGACQHRHQLIWERNDPIWYSRTLPHYITITPGAYTYQILLCRYLTFTLTCTRLTIVGSLFTLTHDILFHRFIAMTLIFLNDYHNHVDMTMYYSKHVSPTLQGISRALWSVHPHSHTIRFTILRLYVCLTKMLSGLII
jgi:hypothetical protein